MANVARIFRSAVSGLHDIYVATHFTPYDSAGPFLRCAGVPSVRAWIVRSVGAAGAVGDSPGDDTMRTRVVHAQRVSP